MSYETQIQRQWHLPQLVQPEENTGVESCDALEIDEMIQSTTKLYRVKEKNLDESVKIHSILKIMSDVTDSMMGISQSNNRSKSTFNIFMGDVSSSMSSFWPSVVRGWNTYIKPNLVGRSAIITFGSVVTTKRMGHKRILMEI